MVQQELLTEAKKRLGEDKSGYEDLVKLYQKQGKRIFSKDGWKKLSSLAGVVDERYSQEGIERVLQEYFGNHELKDVLKDVLITSYDLETRRPFFFKSIRAKTDPSRNYPLWKAARATSAAPTYFEPLKITTNDELTYYSLVDGGLYANNPSMCAYAEVTNMGWHELIFVSLGTGETSAQSISHESAKNWGVMEWIKPLIDVMMDGNSDTVAYQLNAIIKTLPHSEYFRLQPKLTKDSSDMDNVKKSNLRKLKLITSEFISENSNTIDRICELLTYEEEEAVG